MYNHRDSLYPLLDKINNNADTPVIIVNDGSTDGLDQTKLGSAVFLEHSENRGKGAALKTGLNHAREAGYSHAITLDADGQHDPELLPFFNHMLQTHPKYFIVGSRDLTDRSMPFHRKLSNNITSLMLSLRTGKKILDAQVGYRCYPLNDRQLWNSIEDGFQFESDVFIRAARMKYALAWQPISVIYSGQRSNMHLVKDTLRFVRTYLRSFVC